MKTICKLNQAIYYFVYRVCVCVCDQYVCENVALFEYRNALTTEVWVKQKPTLVGPPFPPPLKEFYFYPCETHTLPHTSMNSLVSFQLNTEVQGLHA